MLSEEHRRFLLRIAREAVREKLRKSEAAPPAVPDESLLARHGVFVSLHAGEQLRGCIGVIEAERPLVEAVARCAISAATEDPRFPPVTMDELPAIRFEISVLSPPVTIASAREIEIGRHGVIVTGAGRKALLLPQVASREGWGADEFLTAACRKAGLHATAWRGEAVRLEVFTAEVFAERP